MIDLQIKLFPDIMHHELSIPKRILLPIPYTVIRLLQQVRKHKDYIDFWLETP